MLPARELRERPHKRCLEDTGFQVGVNILGKSCTGVANSRSWEVGREGKEALLPFYEIAELLLVPTPTGKLSSSPIPLNFSFWPSPTPLFKKAQFKAASSLDILVAQWLSIHLTIQRTCRLIPDLGGSHMLQATKPCAAATEPVLWSLGAQTLRRMPQLLRPAPARARALQQEKPQQWEASAPQLEVASRSPQPESTHSNKYNPSSSTK